MIVSGVDEEDAAYSALSPKELVIALAIVKAHTVAKNFSTPALVIGCDSTFEFEGESLGKPLTSENAISRAKLLRGKSGVLHTGHSIIDTKKQIEISDIASTKVFFADMSDKEIESYVATGEPLKVAGAFTIDGLGGAFLRSIEGDAHTVIGLSLPVLRELVISLGVEYPSLWNK